VEKDKFYEVQGSKRLIGRGAQHSTTAWWYPFGIETRRLSNIRCTYVYQGVATRNGATTREILAHRTGVQPNFAFTEFYEVQLALSRILGRISNILQRPSNRKKYVK